MEYGYSILMGVFACAILLYAGMMALFKDYKMLPLRARVSVKPKNEKKYMQQLAKVVALAAIAPALSSIVGLWNILVAVFVMIIAFIIFVWLGTKLMRGVE